MILVPPNVQSRIQAARNATKHKKANFLSSTTQQQETNKKEELDDEATGNFFSYLDAKQTEEHVSSVRVGPSMPQTNSQSHFEDAISTDAVQVTESDQQQAAASTSMGEERLTEGLDTNTSTQLDPEAVSLCVYLNHPFYLYLIARVI